MSQPRTLFLHSHVPNVPLLEIFPVGVQILKFIVKSLRNVRAQEFVSLFFHDLAMGRICFYIIENHTFYCRSHDLVLPVSAYGYFNEGNVILKNGV